MSPAACQRLVLVSGLSGAGKSTALRALEDLGFYCVDNLPAGLLKTFIEHVQTDPHRFADVALGIDARSSAADLGRLATELVEWQAAGLQHQLLYLTANRDAILKRFGETRRRHPLVGPESSLSTAIDQEAGLLQTLQQQARRVIDTSDMHIHELRHQVWRFVGFDNASLTVVLESFAYSRGVPQDADFVFDVRHCPNPHWEESLRSQTGKDEAVASWLAQHRSIQAMQADIVNFLQHWLPEIRQGQRSHVTIGIGCTGGKHRSVYLVEQIGELLQPHFHTVIRHHRELGAA